MHHYTTVFTCINSGYLSLIKKYNVDDILDDGKMILKKCICDLFYKI